MDYKAIAKMYGNPRLDELAKLIESGEATTQELEEFELTANLAGLEAGGAKPWRKHEGRYKEKEKMRSDNESLRQ